MIDMHFSKAKGPAPDEAEEIIVDCFAGGGGASLGIEMALGRSPDLAINHDPEALEMHRVNHPRTQHFIEDIRNVDPLAVCAGRPVGLAWFSPDCKHHSNAKGGPPIRSREIRALAWTVVDWAKAVRPRVIILENVREFLKWGPLDDNNRIIKDRIGEEFEFWWKRMEHLGYRGEMRILKACDLGAKTTRERLYIVWRCDGEAIVWPEPTHGPGRALPYGTAAECIDWTIPCPSIFMTKRQAKAFKRRTGISVKRPLAPKTLARIARGLRKYLFESAKPFFVPRPFFVPVTHAGYRADGTTPRNDERVYDATQPMPTITGANRGEIAVVAPMMANVKTYGGGGNEATAADQPLRTVVAASKRGEIAVVTPVLSSYYGEQPGHGRSRATGIDEPIPTQTAGGNRFALVAPVAVRTDMHQSNAGCAYSVEAPLNTVTTGGGFAVAHAELVRTAHGEQDSTGKRRGQGAHSMQLPLPTVCASSVDYAVAHASLVQTGYGERPGQEPRCLDIQTPLGTVVGCGQRHALVQAFLAKHFGQRKGGWNEGQDLRQPTGTVTTRDHHSLVTANMIKLRGTSDGHMDASSSGADEPVPTVSAHGNHVGAVQAFLTKYNRTGTDEPIDAPLDTLTTRDRYNLIWIDGHPYEIRDIGMRMLTPRELFRAQGFPDSYIIDPVYNGKPLSKEAQVRMCGNSVCPPVACALVTANYQVRRVAVSPACAVA